MLKKLYIVMHLESSDNYNQFSKRNEFIKLSDKFFKSYSNEIKHQKKDKRTKRGRIEFEPNNLVDIIYYRLSHFTIGVININGEDKIYTINKDDYLEYNTHTLVCDLFYDHLVYNPELNSTVIKEEDKEAKEISIILYSRLKKGEGRPYKIENDKINLGIYKDVDCFKYDVFYIGYVKHLSKNIFFIKEEPLYPIYKKWRWLTYTQLNGKTSTIEDIIEGRLSNDNERLIPNKLIDNYKNKNFEVSEEIIKKYDNEKKLYVEEIKQNPLLRNMFGSQSFINSTFIENCFIAKKEFEKKDIIKRIKRNLIFYHWWDKYTFDEFCFNIANGYFLRSTQKLLGIEPLIQYFKSRFISKKEFIKHLLSNFNPRDWNIKEMESPSRKVVMFDYNYLFQNEFLSSIRIFENECRFDFDERIIGAFYNEDLLFREVKKVFGDRYEVISQGTPEWLRPQRFDIYLPEINFAIEYQGEQHFMPVDFGGKGKKIAQKQFEENQRRDKLKKEKSFANNCFLHYVYPSYNMEAVISELKKLIKKKEKDSFLINEEVIKTESDI